MTAYLLAVFRLDGDVPVFLGTEIHGSPEPPFTTRVVTFIVDEADGSTYSEATRRLIDKVKSRPWQQWAIRSLVKR